MAEENQNYKLVLDKLNNWLDVNISNYKLWKDLPEFKDAKLTLAYGLAMMTYIKVMIQRWIKEINNGI